MKRLLFMSSGFLALVLWVAGCPPALDEGTNGLEPEWPDPDDPPEPVSSIEVGCTVTVPYTSDHQRPRASGTFHFTVVLESPASVCWIEFWDDRNDYCEGSEWDEMGEPRDCRPPWYLVQSNASGVEAGTSWHLGLDYIRAEPPVEGKSWFVCEHAGDPENGTGDFWAYLGCCDETQDHCEIVQLADW